MAVLFGGRWCHVRCSCCQNCRLRRGGEMSSFSLVPNVLLAVSPMFGTQQKPASKRAGRQVCRGQWSESEGKAEQETIRNESLCKPSRTNTAPSPWRPPLLIMDPTTRPTQSHQPQSHMNGYMFFQCIWIFSVSAFS